MTDIGSEKVLLQGEISSKKPVPKFKMPVIVGQKEMNITHITLKVDDDELYTENGDSQIPANAQMTYTMMGSFGLLPREADDQEIKANPDKLVQSQKQNEELARDDEVSNQPKQKEGHIENNGSIMQSDSEKVQSQVINNLVDVLNKLKGTHHKQATQIKDLAQEILNIKILCDNIRNETKFANQAYFSMAPEYTQLVDTNIFEDSGENKADLDKFTEKIDKQKQNQITSEEISLKSSGVVFELNVGGTHRYTVAHRTLTKISYSKLAHKF